MAEVKKWGSESKNEFRWWLDILMDGASVTDSGMVLQIDSGWIGQCSAMKDLHEGHVRKADHFKSSEQQGW